MEKAMTNTNIITVNLYAVNIMSEKGGKFVFEKEAEDSLLKLLNLNELLEQMLKKVKEKIEADGLSLDENFKGVKGEFVSAIYKLYGEKYTFAPEMLEVCKPYLKEKVTYKVDSELVDKFFEENGALPEGIRLVARSKTISLTLTKHGKELTNSKSLELNAETE
jgi:hypothetical protein